MGPGWLHGPGRTGGQPCVRRSPGGFIGRVHRSSTPGGNHPFIGGYRSARHRFERGGLLGVVRGAWCRHKVGAC